MSSSAATGLVPLTDKQEQRLSFWLDEQLLQLTRGYEGRHGEKSTMPTITHFLKATEPVLEVITSIPPLPPSDSLRVAYMLTLTGLLSDALSAYEIRESALSQLWTYLRRMDSAWTAVLDGTPARSDATAAATAQAAPGSTRMTWTDRARLSSLVSDVKSNLAIALGLPGGEARREYNPRGQIVEPRLLGPEGVMTDGADEQVQQMEAEAEATPSLGDGTTSEDMSVDTTMEGEGGDESDEDDEDEDEAFEEVDVTSPSQGEVFSIHFAAGQPLASNAPVNDPSNEAEQLQQRPGFDPDAEYGDDSVDTEEDRGIVIESKKVFEATLRRLEEYGRQS